MSSWTLIGPIIFSRCGVSPSCTRCDTTLAPTRFRKPKPLLPIAVVTTVSPAFFSSRSLLVTARRMLVFKPPHSPLSVVINDDAGGLDRIVVHQERVAVLGIRPARGGPRCCGILSAYGRARRMRSCALRIFEAATISIALVILRVFCTLLIFDRISLLPGMRLSSCDSVGLEPGTPGRPLEARPESAGRRAARRPPALNRRRTS